MSHYNKIKTQIKNRDNLVKALVKMGFKEENLIVTDDAKHLKGYMGDTRPEKANVIIPKRYVGNSSNDIGWVLGEDGTYEAIISDFDKTRYGKKWQDNLETHYGVEQAKDAFTINGWTYTEETTEEGEIQLVGVHY